MLAAAMVVSLGAGCGGSTDRSLTGDSVSKAFAAHGLPLHRIQPSPVAPAITLLPVSPVPGGSSNWVVWVYPDVSKAMAATAQQSQSLRQTALAWKKLSGKWIGSNGYVRRVKNVVVLRGVGVPTPTDQIAAALDLLATE